MKPLLLLSTLFCLNSAAQTVELPQSVDMKLLTPLEAVLAAPNDYLSQSITIEGKVVAVCESRGCWAELATNDGERLRLKVRDGKTAIPMSARGHNAVATGKLTALKLSKEQTILYLEHMANDANQPFERSSVTEGMTVYNLRPSALKIIYN